MKVGIFLGTSSENFSKRKYLDAFYDSISATKDEAFITKSKEYKKCDVAIIFGFYGINFGDIHQVRKNIYTEHTKRNKQCIFIDADLFRFLGQNKTENETHVRLSFGSIFFDKAIHFNEKSNSDRFEILKSRKQMELKNYRKSGEHILLCLNSNPYLGKGWSAGKIDIYQWAKDKIKEIRKYSNRDIIIRFHPNAKTDQQENIPIQDFTSLDKNLYFSGGIEMEHKNIIKNTSLSDDCQNAWACVVYNTSASTTPIIEGIPVFTSEKTCPVYSIANHQLSKIEIPTLYSREQWLYDTSYSLWHYDEIKNGEVWNRFRKRLNDQGEYSKKAAKKLGI